MRSQWWLGNETAAVPVTICRSAFKKRDRIGDVIHHPHDDREIEGTRRRGLGKIAFDRGQPIRAGTSFSTRCRVRSSMRGAGIERHDVRRLAAQRLGDVGARPAADVDPPPAGQAAEA